LPAPIVNGGGDVLNMEGIQTFKGSWPWPWPWIRPYGILSCITHRPLPTYQISL